MAELEGYRDQAQTLTDEKAELEQKLEGAREDCAGHVRRVSELEKEVEALESREAAVAQREIDVAVKENLAVKAECELKVAEAEKRADLAVELTRLVFQNNIYKHTRAVPVDGCAPMPPHNDQWGNPQPGQPGYGGSVEMREETSEG